MTVMNQKKVRNRKGVSRARKDRAEPQAEPARFSARELAQFREMLLQKRRQIIGDMDHLRYDAQSAAQSYETGGASAMPIHAADSATDTWEQHFTMGLLENRETLLRQIDEALERLAEGTYGTCVATGKPITKARLKAIPWTRYCIEYARQLEE